MIVGVSGSRYEPSEPQVAVVAGLLTGYAVDGLEDWDAPTELHHGDCVGCDAATHRLARALKIRTVGHPPLVGRLRAYCDVDESLPAADYPVRNREIVDAVKALIGLPFDTERSSPRSGTWQTIRYAKSVGRLAVVVYRDGRTEIR